MQPKKIRKAVIAAAGFGTRFLPQTKAMPKEMLPLVDKPIIQYVVEELVSVGVEDIVIVTGYTKRAIEDHFDAPSEDLVSNLKIGGQSKQKLLEQIHRISEMANFIYVRQKGPYGSGTPLLNSEHLIGDEPFIFTYSDDLILSNPAHFRQMLDVYNQYNCSVMPVVRMDKDEDYDRYGFVAGTQIRDNILDVENIVEKPGKDKAPSNLASLTGYLLTPDIFEYLRQQKADLAEGQEFYAIEALMRMRQAGKRVVACEIKDAKYYDAGNKLDYLKTVVEFALRREDIGPAFREYLHTIVKNM